MKKIPTLFERIYEGNKIVGCTPKLTRPEFAEVLASGIPTTKYDGACCAIIGGELYKRYDCKKGKTPPEGAVPCCDPDPVTGHWPHWVKVKEDNPADKWFIRAYKNVFRGKALPEGTYEAIGPHFQGNPYCLALDVMVKHGLDHIELGEQGRTFEGLKKTLSDLNEEGIVFWMDGEPVCKIKRTDFGFEWPKQKGSKT